MTKVDRYPEVFAFAAAHSPRSSSHSVLSFGSSFGLEAETLATKYFPSSSIYGCDVDEETLAKAKQNAPTTTFFLSTIGELRRHGPFDVIFAMSVLTRHPPPPDIHVQYPFTLFSHTLELLAAVLKPNGLLVLYNTNYNLEDTVLASTFTQIPFSPSSSPSSSASTLIANGAIGYTQKDDQTCGFTPRWHVVPGDGNTSSSNAEAKNNAAITTTTSETPAEGSEKKKELFTYTLVELEYWQRRAIQNSCVYQRHT